MVTKGLTMLVIVFALGSSSFASLGLGPVNMTSQASQSPKEKSSGELSCSNLAANGLMQNTKPVRTAARTTTVPPKAQRANN